MAKPELQPTAVALQVGDRVRPKSPIDPHETRGKIFKILGKRATVALDDGTQARIELAKLEKASTPDLQIGDRVRLVGEPMPGGAQVGDEATVTAFAEGNAIAEFERDGQAIAVSLPLDRFQVIETPQPAQAPKTSVRKGKKSRVTNDQPIEVDLQPTQIELNAERQDKLSQLETEIENGLGLVNQGKSLIWRSLATIRSEQLWKLSHHQSFEDYCEMRWGWSKSYAHEVAAAGEVAIGLLESGIPDSDLPTAVSQARELKRIPEDQRAEVWQELITGDESPTASKIQEFYDQQSGNIGDRMEQAAERRKERVDGLIETDENYTPATLIDPARRVLKRIHLDPASCELANEVIQADVIITREQNCLVTDWIQVVAEFLDEEAGEKPNGWFNPGYSYPLIANSINRFLEYWNADKLGNWLVLTNTATDTAWFQQLAAVCTVRLDLKGRNEFYNPYKPNSGGNRQGQVLFYFGGDPEAFYREFEGRGLFYPDKPIDVAAMVVESDNSLKQCLVILAAKAAEVVATSGQYLDRLPGSVTEAIAELERATLDSSQFLS